MNATKQREPTMHDVPFMSAKQKTKVLRAWRRFLKGGMTRNQFTQDIYDHLNQHCSFIAHFDRSGFYDTYFENPTATNRFLDQFDRDKGCLSVEYGYIGWLTRLSYADINQAMVDAFMACKKTIRLNLARAELALATTNVAAAEARRQIARAQVSALS